MGSKVIRPSGRIKLWKSLGALDARVGRTLLSDAFDFDLDFAEDEQEVCSTVEERRFSAA